MSYYQTPGWVNGLLLAIFVGSLLMLGIVFGTMWPGHLGAQQCADGARNDWIGIQNGGYVCLRQESPVR